MLEVRNVDLMNERRQQVRAAALSSNDFLPAGFDRDEAMRSRGFLQVIHDHCLRYSKEVLPEGVPGQRNPPRSGHADQIQRKRDLEAVVTSISEGERQELQWLYSLGFPADLIFLFYRRPILRYEVLTAVLQLKNDKVRRSNCEGRLLTLSGSCANAWLTDAEIFHMASMMSRIQPLAPEEGFSEEEYGKKRLAKVFMSLSRQGEVSGRKMSACEEGTLSLWIDFVRSKCACTCWIGEQWGWNPLVVSEQKRIRHAYASLVARSSSGEPSENSSKRQLQLEEDVRQVRTRLMDSIPQESISVRSDSVEVFLPKTSSSSVDPVQIVAATRGGNNPWSKRRSEFLDILSSKYPSFELDSTFDEEGWLTLVKGKDTRLTGKCKICHTPNGASISNMLGSQGLPKCKGSGCSTSASLPGPKMESEVLDAALIGDDASEEEEEEEMRPKLNHHSDFEAVMAFMETYHPHVRLRGDLMTPLGWKAAIQTQTSSIEVTCLLCDQVRSASSQNILYNGQGFCQACTRLQTGYRKAVAVLSGLLRISNPHMRSQGTGQGQRYCHVDVECMVKDCGWKDTLCTRSYAGILKKDPQAKIIPCKRCNKVEPWRTLAGFHNFQRVLEYYQETRFYRSVLDADSWLQKVTNKKSKVPIQCAICDEIREVRLSSIQQGGSVGCGCLRSSYALEAELLKIIPSVNIHREVKLIGGLKMDFAYFFDEDANGSRSQYLKACQDLKIQPSSGKVKIGIELDGRQHFSWVIFSEPNEQIGLRDFHKDVAACESGTTLIRLQQISVWEDAPHWKDFLRSALMYAISTPGGRIICEDSPNYTHASKYADMRSSGCLSTLRRSEKIAYGVIRELQS